VSFISDADLELIRGVDEALMPSTCQVLRRPVTTSGGRAVYGEETVVADVDCRLSHTRQRPQEFGAVGRLGETAFGQISLPQGTDVLGGDRIRVTTEDRTDVFTVVGDPWPGSFSSSLVATVQRED
jgi:hypothetical protein